jgi:hypothetical protein
VLELPTAQPISLGPQANYRCVIEPLVQVIPHIKDEPHVAPTFIPHPSCEANMPLLNRLLSLAVLGVSAVPSVLSFQPGFSYGSEKVRGVNLGGWLVLEVRNAYIL